MLLGVDASRAAGARTGVGRYVEYLLREWSRVELPFNEVHVFSPCATGVVPTGDARFRERTLPARTSGFGWQQRRLRPAAAEVDVFFSPYAAPVFLRPPVVIANLGIYEGALATPGWRSRLQSRHFAHSARKAVSVVANSEATRQELARRYGVDPGKVSVVWPGIDERFRPAAPEDRVAIEAAVVGALGGPSPYLLFVGKLSHRRNVPALLEAFVEIERAYPGLQLLVVGPDTSRVDVRARARDLGVAHAVHHVDHVDQDTLAHLYRSAAAFVLPTQAEGFSFTIPEALASGAPVVTLRHDTLVEAGLDEVVIALPDPDPRRLADAVLGLLGDPAESRRLREAGPVAVRRLSWAENARRTMEILARARRTA